MPTPQTWLQWAKQIMPHGRKEWLTAMEAELSSITDKIAGQSFAFGCFKTAIFEATRSRRGLHIIARAAGAFLIFMMSFAGILVSLKLGATPETVVESKMILGLCLFYMAASGLFILSLRGLQIYASIGLCFAVSGWGYCILTRPRFETISTEYLTAISIEATGFMAGLILATIYLNWLYTPRTDDA